MAALAKIEGVREVRGQGLMIGVELDSPVSDLRKHLLFKHHIFTGSSSNPNVIRLLPALNIGPVEVERFLKGFKQAMMEKAVVKT
jgi:acetylornithine aminotransferase